MQKYRYEVPGGHRPSTTYTGTLPVVGQDVDIESSVLTTMTDVPYKVTMTRFKVAEVRREVKPDAEYFTVVLGEIKPVSPSKAARTALTERERG